ncbi:MAG: S8 family serine peptidase [Chitinophagaceae bacterium]
MFSSDGPRRIFYNPDSTEITPGNLLYNTNGGTVLQKPDITAGDGAQTTTPGFIPFYGTSAAAPHAAAIAALLKSKIPGITPAQIRTALTSSAIDIETPGFDRDAGAGIILAYEALLAAGATPQAALELGTVTATEASGNGNGVVEPGDNASLTVQIKNISPAAATNVSAILTTSTPGINITQNTANYGDIAGQGSAVNTATPYLFTVYPQVPCGTVINFTLTINFGGGNPKVLNFTFIVGAQGTPTIIATLGSAPPAGTGYTVISGTQTNRTFRGGVVSTCTTPKASPGVSAASNLAYHAYTFTNSGTTGQCVTVNMATANVNTNYAVAYNNSGFVPATPGVNYLADAGLSNASQTFSFTAPPGQQFTIVVHEIVAGSGTAAPYNLNVDLRSCVAPPVIINASSPVEITAENAVPANNAPDPGETLTVNLPLINIGTGNSSNLVATLLPTGGVTSPSGPQTYGVVTGGGPAVKKPFTFTAAGNCGDNITLTLSLKDGAADLGTVTYTLQLGTVNVFAPTTFSNTTPILVPGTGTGATGGAPASPYSSDIAVSGLTGKISKITVGLKQFNHTWPDDAGVLLVSPTGQKMIIMSEAGDGTDAVNVNLVLDDAATASLPATGAIASGTYKPTNISTAGDAYVSPAPSGTLPEPRSGRNSYFRLRLQWTKSQWYLETFCYR